MDVSQGTSQNGSNIDRGGRPRKKVRGCNSTGRPRVSAEDASRTTLYRRAMETAEFAENNVTILEKALNLAKQRNPDEDKETDSCSPCDEQVQNHSKQTALALFLEMDLTKEHWMKLRADQKKRAVKIYPHYKSISEAKAECIPEECFVSESEIRVSLQSLLNKSAKRLLQSVQESFSDDELLNLKLIVSAGFDSSGGHRNPHQAYQEAANYSDKSHQELFATTLTILALETGSGIRKWTNPTPQSTRFCRPVRLSFEKEDYESINAEKDRLDAEKSALRADQLVLSNGRTARVQYDVRLTGLDGKCLNAVLKNRSTQRCPLCTLTQKQFRNLDASFSTVQGSLHYGIGLLHCYIRTFEMLLVISYKLPFKTWSVGSAFSESFKLRQELVKKRLWETFQIKADQVEQGYGKSNTGNIAKKCLKDPKAFAEALELDEQLVTNLSTILLCFSSKNQLNLCTLKQLCRDTYRLFYEKYDWAEMRPTVHKYLIHGCDIAETFNLPLSYYIEDAAEAWHKLFRRYGERNARQTSRENRLQDVFNRALYLSDPLISLIQIDDRLL